MDVSKIGQSQGLDLTSVATINGQRQRTRFAGMQHRLAAGFPAGTVRPDILAT